MYKVLVVDDFGVDRALVIDAIADLPIEIAGECANGIEALELARHLRPDIMICDIEMPHMTGIELADALNDEGIRVHIVFCSLYSKPNYMQSAIAIKCDAYLLKPFLREELRSSVLHVIDLISEREERMREAEDIKRLMRENRQQLVSNLCSDLIFGRIESEDELSRKASLLDFSLGGQFQLALIEMDEPVQPARMPANYDALTLSYKVQRLIQSTISGCADRQLIRLSDKQYVIVARYDAVRDEQAESRALHVLCQQLIDVLREMGISVSVTISDRVDSAMKLRSLCEQCTNNIRFKSIIGSGQIIRALEVPESAPSAEIDLIALQKEIRFFLNSTTPSIRADIDRLVQAHSERLNPIQMQILFQYILVCVQIALQENNLRISDVCGEEHVVWQKFFELSSLEEQKRWVSMIASVSHNYLLGRSDDKKKCFIQDVKDYIDGTDLRTVSIGSVAEHFSYSPNYINHVFKDETDMTILDFITLCRINRAKELLKTSDMKLADIADQLGYSYASYFSAVFKKIEGMSPKAYAERKGY